VHPGQRLDNVQIDSGRRRDDQETPSVWSRSTELGIARRIHSSILPQTMPRISKLTIAARYRRMTAVAGDFYDYREVDAKRLGILVADVTGHGVPVASTAFERI
jgi:serine phosphatase RsbU (regulator of sigma subunit)